MRIVRPLSCHLAILLGLALAGAASAADQVWLSDLAWASATSGWGPIEKDRSNGEQGSSDGHPLTVAGTTYAKGLGVHATSEIVYSLGGAYSAFQSDLGLDDEVGNRGSVVFQVLVDGALRFDSGTLTGASARKTASVSLTGAKELRLRVGNAGDNFYFDHADWAGAILTKAVTAVAKTALWIAGDAQVQLLPGDPLADGRAPIWSWDAYNSAPGLASGRRSWFQCVDEAKPVSLDGTPCVLITSSSSGGVALVRRSDRSLLFSLEVGMAHSAELLPGGYVAIAGSDGTDAIVLAKVSAGPNATTEIARYGLAHAHGTVFEPAKNRLWTCGGGIVRVYGWNGSSLSAQRDIALPTSDAHDLEPDPYAGGLVVTTGAKVWRVDPVSFAVAPFAPLATRGNVKSVSIDAATGRLAYTQGENGQWWTEHIYVLPLAGAQQTLTFAGRELYKTRWDQSCQLGR
jgi:hypothetical protein